MISDEERQILRRILPRLATQTELIKFYGLTPTFVRDSPHMPPPVYRRRRWILYDVDQVQTVHDRFKRTYHKWTQQDNEKLFHLREEEHWPWKKIGRALGVTENAAISRYKWLQTHDAKM